MKKSRLFMAAVAFAAYGASSAQPSSTSMSDSGNSFYHTESGYRGIIDYGYTVGKGKYAEDALTLTTSHGYQINPYLFVGGGVGVNYYQKVDVWSVPIFATVRATLLDRIVSPFADIKIGYAVSDVKGFYFSPTIGCRFNRFTMNTSYQWTLFYKKVSEVPPLYFFYNVHGLIFKIGYEI